MSSGYMETMKIEELCREYIKLKNIKSDLVDFNQTADGFRLDAYTRNTQNYLGTIILPQVYNKKIFDVLEDYIIDCNERMLDIRNEIADLALGKERESE